MVTSDYWSPVTVTSYSWDTTGCFTVDGGNVRCFPDGKIAQNISEDAVLARDAGTVRCTAVINGISFKSEPFSLRIKGMH